LRSPPPRTVPVRLRGNETARSYLRRLKDDRAVTRNRVHKSESLGQSRRWYVQEVAAQRGEGRLFEDPFFPADDSSIRRGGKPGCSEYDWLRPHEVTRDPKFIIDGISRFDVKQGEIDIITEATSHARNFPLLFQVVPSGQTFSMQDCNNDKTIPYCGMFWFRFWRFGEWYDVVVDDRLPTRRGRLVFMHSSDRNEFWSALLEKAYVKLLGTYEAMKGGNTAEAMEDFTGGLTELMDLGAKAPPDLFRIMERAHCRSSLMACSIDATPEQVESEGPYGLILGHAYSVTDVRTVSSKEPTKQVRLIRLRNPWGNDREWYGPWSDKSSEWNAISVSERKRIGLVFDNDGEFWISYEDFVRYFSRLEFCHLGPETGHFGQPSRLEKPRGYWEMTTEVGEWIKYSTAGGCRNNERTFHMNPQFRVHVIDPDETDDDNTGTIIIGLMQMGRRENFQEHHTIGYALYLIPENYPSGMLLPRSFFERNVSKCRSPAFINIREVCGRHKLPPGEYMIIPSTFEPNQEAKFLLRIFSEKPCNTSELDDPTTISHDEAADLSGALGFAEFKKLWMDLRIWK
ncbi:calpain family cysteine protease, partial [Opisthorchis viverrini]